MEIANYVDKVRPGVYFVGKVPAPQRTGDHVAPELPPGGLARWFLRGTGNATEAPGGLTRLSYVTTAMELLFFGWKFCIVLCGIYIIEGLA